MRSPHCIGLQSKSDLEENERRWCKWSLVLRRAHYFTGVVVRRRTTTWNEGGRGEERNEMRGMNNERVCKHNPTFAQQRRACARRHRERPKGVRTREEARSAHTTLRRSVWIPRFTFTTLTTNSTELPRHKRADWVSQGWLELRVRVTQPASHSSPLFSSSC